MTDTNADPASLGHLPKQTGKEMGAKVVEAGITLVPFVGGAAAELFGAVIGPSLNKRRDEWMERLGEAVEDLRHRVDGFDIHDLEGNEEFVSAVLSISQVAMKTHEQEKLEALRAAVVSAGLPGAPDDFRQVTFVRYVDELTPLHLNLLRFLDDPAAVYSSRKVAQPQFMSAGLSAIIEPIFPGLTKLAESGNRSLAEQVVTDLTSRGLTIQFSYGGSMQAQSLWVSRTSAFGRDFLSYIGLRPHA